MQKNENSKNAENWVGNNAFALPPPAPVCVRRRGGGGCAQAVAADDVESEGDLLHPLGGGVDALVAVLDDHVHALVEPAQRPLGRGAGGGGGLGGVVA